MALTSNSPLGQPEKNSGRGLNREIKTETPTPSLTVEVPLSETEASQDLEADIKKVESSPSAESDLPSLAPATVQAPPTEIALTKSVNLQKIESILEEDMQDIYSHLDVAHQQIFREEGERAARQIETILATGKSIAVKILAVVKRWLQTIPGINKFFIEQEAKIKTDKLSRLNNLPPHP